MATLSAEAETVVRVLLVEDSDDDAELLRRSLRNGRFEITRVAALEPAIAELRVKTFDVVLLDLSLPDGYGFDTFATLRPHAGESAVIVLTGMDDESLGLKTVQAGAQDYVVKGTLTSPVMTRAIRHALERKRSEVVTTQYAHELAVRNDQMREDLQLAREVQQAFLPSHCPTFPIGGANPSLQFVHKYVPAGEVGGDFFDVFPLSQEVAGVIVCDVMGHGVRAALVTAMLRALIGPHNQSAHDPGLMLDDVNQRLRAILRNCDSVMFVTAVYLVVNAVTGEVRSANAGHPRPLRVTRSSDASVLSGADQPVGPPLGLVETPAYKTFSGQLSSGDRVFLYTDGVYEMEGATGDSFGQARLQQEVQAQAALKAEPFLETLMTRLRAYAKGGEFSDDACLLTMDFRR